MILRILTFISVYLCAQANILRSVEFALAFSIIILLNVVLGSTYWIAKRIPHTLDVLEVPPQVKRELRAYLGPAPLLWVVCAGGIDACIIYLIYKTIPNYAIGYGIGSVLYILGRTAAVK